MIAKAMSVEAFVKADLPVQEFVPTRRLCAWLLMNATEQKGTAMWCWQSRS